MSRFTPGPRKSILSGQASIKEQPKKYPICFNFGHLDESQGQTLDDWEKELLLSRMLTRFKVHG